MKVFSDQFKQLFKESRVTPETVTVVPQPYTSAQPSVETPVTVPVTEVVTEPVSETVAKSEPSPTEAESVKARFCSECGTPLKEGMTFCGNCGKKIGKKKYDTIHLMPE